MRRLLLAVCFCVFLAAPMGALAGRAVTPTVEWRFDRPGDLLGWQPNADLADVRVADGALQCRGVGSDPILDLRTPLDIPASPWQFVEITLSADRDGNFEVFWSGTTQGPYGGLSGDRMTTFAVRGDGQMRAYRIYPFWQKERRIVRLRVDPFDGARFAITRVRVAAAEGRRLAAPGATASVPGGTAVTRVAGYGFAVLDRADRQTDTRDVLALTLTSGRTSRASVVFATTASYGLHEFSFALAPDGRRHTYNLSMAGSPEWNGRLVALGIQPGDRPGDRVVLHGIARGPAGPPDLRVLSLGVEEALPRAGTTVSVRARVTNAGGALARRVSARLALPAGARLTGSVPQAPRDLRPGQQDDWRWRVTFAAPTNAPLRLRVVGANCPPAAASAPSHVTARLRLPQTGVVPEPRPVRGPYEVGVYYFPGWRSASQWAPIMGYPERTPVLGWYREGDPRVADWQIKWAVEHGITFFAYDWYWTQGARQLEHGLDAYFHSRFRRHLKFCLLWANHNPPGTSSVEDSIAVARYWVANYFRQPEYLTVEGKPVVIIFSTYRFREDLGSDGVRRAFDAMRAECRKAGLPGLYLVACVGGAGEARQTAAEGYDAVTAYNWPGLGMQGGERWAPFSSLVPAYRQHWQEIADQSGIPMLLPLSGGWDARPWQGSSALVRSDRTPALFQQHLRDARAFLKANPERTLPMALVEAWNEWGEGSYIEPHKEFGFGYLDAIRTVFTSARPAHVDVTPVDVGMAVPQVSLGSLTRTRWDFSRGLEGWESGMNIGAIGRRPGGIQATTTSGDAAFFGPPMQLPAERCSTVRVRMRLTNLAGPTFADQAQLFWSTRAAAESEATSVHFAVKGDGHWHDYRARVAGNPRWGDLITRLRFDPCSRARVRVDLALIALEAPPRR